MLLGGERVDVAGESHYQDALERIVGGKTERGWDEPVIAHLVRETTNRYDGNAVRVMVGEALVGYLTRADAAAYQRPLRDIEGRHELATCHAHIVGGWRRQLGCGEEDEGHFGIWLDLAGSTRCVP